MTVTVSCFHGVGFIISPQVKHCILGCVPVNDRIMKFKLSGAKRFLTIHVPHGTKPNDENQQFWSLLPHKWERHAGSTPCIIIGVMKARTHCKQISELDLMRPYTFGRGTGYVEEMPGDQFQNRPYLIDLCRYNNCCTPAQPPLFLSKTVAREKKKTQYVEAA